MRANSSFVVEKELWERYSDMSPIRHGGKSSGLRRGSNPGPLTITLRIKGVFPEASILPLYHEATDVAEVCGMSNYIAGWMPQSFVVVLMLESSSATFFLCVV